VIVPIEAQGVDCNQSMIDLGQMLNVNFNPVEIYIIGHRFPTIIKSGLHLTSILSKKLIFVLLHANTQLSHLISLKIAMRDLSFLTEK
jgi:hypothetical protein